MTRRVRSLVALAALMTIPAAVVAINPGGAANATPCISGGGRIYQYCASLPSAITGYVPTPGLYAPLPGDPVPPSFEQCVSYNGRWALTGACG